MIAVVPVRAGLLPAGAATAVAEAGGRVLLVGDDTDRAADELPAVTDIVLAEVGPFAPGRAALLIASAVDAEDLVVLPASPDGRDLAPRLAAVLHRPLLAGAVRAHPDEVIVARFGGRVAERVVPEGPVVVTVEPGPPDAAGRRRGTPRRRRLDLSVAPPEASDVADAELIEVAPPDPSSMDLAEAPRIVAGGAGLGGADRFALLASVATALGASMGATRVVTDAGLVPHERQIGTTGVAVDPDVYVAFGISGAVQHTGGLGHPDHVIAVNTDASCPMMAMADVAIVADAGAVLEELAARVGVGPAAADATRVGP